MSSIDAHPTTAATADPSAGSPAFIPLEANPELMTTLLHNLGLSSALQIHDVYSLTDETLLSFIPRPALALLLVFPVSAAYESHRLAEDSLAEPYAGRGPNEPVLWFRQTIRNACGMMGLLHAAANGPARGFVAEGSELDALIRRAEPLGPAERSKLLEESEGLAKAHRDAAVKGDTAAPEATDDVDLHYVCFVKTDDGTLWELDGRRKGPIKRGELPGGEDVLGPNALALGPLKFLEREGGDLRFSCVALAGSLD
jgi:ubiquitin carboxyl-terminal hydrolase L3